MNNLSLLPKHIAIIMDGNGRWAEERGKSRAEGHAQGVNTLRSTLKLCREFGIDYLTAYAFSTENWKRPQAEVEALMSLLLEYLKIETETLYQEKVQLRVIGNTALLPEPIQQALHTSIKRLAIAEHKQVLTLALSYGGRDEIVRATKAISRDILASKLTPDEITEDLFTSYLDNADIPDPDLLIRTAGELRLSNFLLWQLSYAELYATDVYWPDFSRDELQKALTNYQGRIRKFGNIQKNT